MKARVCVVCGTIFTPRSWNSTMTPICSPPCKDVRRKARAKVVLLPCVGCGMIVEAKGAQALSLARRGRAYCSDLCKRWVTSRIAAQNMSLTNRRFRNEIVSRMKTQNPMKDPAARARASGTLKAMGWRPLVRGGNGHPTPIPQQLLADALGWPTEVIVPTKGRALGYPTHYKLDIANRKRRIAIEVDGGSHNSRKVREADERKSDFLSWNGWIVLRFTNSEILSDLEGCAQTVWSTTSRSKGITTTSPMDF